MRTVGADITQFSLTLSGNYGDGFCFRVYAFNAVGDSRDSNIACKTLPDASSLPPVTLPSTPNNLHATLASAGMIRLAWDDVQDESQYLLERRLNNTTGMQIILTADQIGFYGPRGGKTVGLTITGLPLLIVLARRRLLNTSAPIHCRNNP